MHEQQSLFLSLYSLTTPPPSLFSPLPFQISSQLPLILLGFYAPATTVTVTTTTTTATTLVSPLSGRTSFLVPLPKFSENGNAPVNHVQPARPFSVHPVPSDDAKQPMVVNSAKVGPGSSNVSGSSSSKEQQSKPFSGQEIKRRKRHRRKHFQDQEPCVMRGVYFKNMKWQAAIKVDKKQIHLGTVGSQEEAAHLYDRAAFMCGREPNFELPEEEKDELRQFKWEEFLAMTRHAITNKKHKRRLGAGLQKHSEPPQQNSDMEGEQGTNGFSASEDVEPDTSA